MKHVSFIIIMIISLFSIVGCTNKEIPFLLDSPDYEKSEIASITKKEYETFVDDKKSFVMFIYQPLCVTSNELEKIVKNFSEKYQLKIYQMPFSTMKKTHLKNKIQYYPSFVIFKDGEMIDYLEADKEEDEEKYRKNDAFEKWIKKYIKLEKTQKSEK